MKILLALQGFPPELMGGTENSARETAHALVRAGHEVVIVAGSDRWQDGFRLTEQEEIESRTGRVIRVFRIHRDDLYFCHWQKSLSVAVGRTFQEVLRRERPDLVHVHHWLRLSRDLVWRAAQEGIPAMVTLHDMWSTCLVCFRIRPDTRDICTTPLAASACTGCAAHLVPRTPWRSAAEVSAEADRFRQDLIREVRLARAVVALSHAHVRQVEAVTAPRGVPVRPLLLGCDLDLPRKPPLAPPAELGVLRLGCWATLHPLKGQDTLIEAVRLAAGGPLPIELHLAGNQSDAAFIASLRTAAAAADLAVFVHGSYPAGGLPFHPVTDVHLMIAGTRALETWGVVIDEAVALGLPMILPESGAYPEHIGGRGRGALFYERSNAESLAAVLRRLQREPGLVAALRAELPTLREILPTVEAHVGQLERIYRDVCAQGAPAVEPIDRDREEADEAAQRAWDRALESCSPEQLGF
ncbi:MAG: glycosyltransferase [Planctomycetes bacterium]|nr:glycosyltransferase [Planctomycetota bacterium]